MNNGFPAKGPDKWMKDEFVDLGGRSMGPGFVSMFAKVRTCLNRS